MDERNWEGLNEDCLVNIFGRVGIESLILNIPFVCKSWHKASLNPLCWKCLVFTKIEPYYGLVVDDPIEERFMEVYRVQGGFSITGFIKLVVSRSCRVAEALHLPEICTREALDLVSNECPSLRVLALPDGLVRELGSYIPKIIGKWKDLEILRLGYCADSFQEILTQINLQCKKFVGLFTFPGFDMRTQQAQDIVTLLPNIKYLSLKDACLPRENLEMILKGCRELEHLDTRDCIGFEVDDEILSMTSNIKQFESEGSISFALVGDVKFEFDGLEFDEHFDFSEIFTDEAFDADSG